MKSEQLRRTECRYSIKWKGGDAYSKVPKRILAPPPLKVRGARPGEVMDLDHWIRQGEDNNAWPGQEAVLNVVRGFSLVQEHKAGTTLKGRATEKGQPEMRQA